MTHSYYNITIYYRYQQKISLMLMPTVQKIYVHLSYGTLLCIEVAFKMSLVVCQFYSVVI